MITVIYETQELAESAIGRKCKLGNAPTVTLMGPATETETGSWAIRAIAAISREEDCFSTREALSVLMRTSQANGAVFE